MEKHAAVTLTPLLSFHQVSLASSGYFCKGVNLRWTTRHKRMINTSNPLVSTCSPRQSAPTSLPVSWKLASLPTVSQGQLWVQNASWAFQKLVPFGLQPAATMLYPGTPLQHVLYSVPSPVSHATSREPQIQSSSPTPYNSDQTSGVKGFSTSLILASL